MPAAAQAPVINQYVSDSDPYPIPRTGAPKDAPNVLVWMIDDLGFGQLGAFGGPIDTPSLDTLAANGLVYTNYHTTPICSASRAALLTGRNSHTVHIGGHSAMSIGFTGHDARVPRGAGTIAANLKQAGYLTYAIGKWDHLPPEHSSQAGPFTYWPSGQGFDKFYGFLTYDADNFSPVLWSDHTPVQLPEDPDYHLTSDMADKAIDWIGLRDSKPDRRPFFMYWATGAVHSPHQAPESYRLAYRGRFDQGWDTVREKTLDRQKSLGIVPAETELPPRPEGMPAWEDLSADQKKSYARAMEVFAAQLTHADHEFGRILASMKARNELDNTLIIVIADNGASAEGAPDGLYSEFLMANGRYPGVEENLEHYEEWGGPDTYPHYPMGWAVAGNTPFQYYKQTAYEGAVHVPMIVSWPKGIAAEGEQRNQYLHAIDIADTVFESAGVEPPAEINGTEQIPFDGTSIARTFNKADAPSSRTVQYYEMYGNRAIYADGWKAVVPHRLKTWDFTTPPSLETDTWQLFHIADDINERVDLAGKKPDKLAGLVEIFQEQAQKYNVFPLANTGDAQRLQAKAAAERMAEHDYRWTYDGPVERIPEALAPPVQTHSFSVTAEVDLPERTNGVLMAIGGHNGGMSFYLEDGRPHFTFRNIDLVTTQLSSSEALQAGPASISLDFKRRQDGADVEIEVSGRTVATGAVPGPLPVFLFTSNETFDIGSDTGSSAAGYDGRFPFTGVIDSVKVSVEPSVK
ncbi:arylsulfatase [Henriciella aquimarina]|uniref:arylsulfatase n=1 Tax=Henriciella aquimarina TaxID=545261 RepID=UPI001301EC74|nr:arylsulfatase [Henriciella aquimarina]